MIPELPLYINIVFIITTLLTVFLFYRAANRSITTLTVITGWMLVQAGLAFSGFYTVTDTFPPRFALIAVPAIVFIIILFLVPAGRKDLDGLDPRTMTILHIVRIPVELTLYWLFLNKAVPDIMTFALVTIGLFSELLSQQTAKQAAWRGWCFGTGLWAAGVWWLFVSLHDYGNTPTWLAILMVAFVATLMGSFTGVKAHWFVHWRCIHWRF